jgi:hypothetical protein
MGRQLAIARPRLNGNFGSSKGAYDTEGRVPKQLVLELC